MEFHLPFSLHPLYIVAVFRTHEALEELHTAVGGEWKEVVESEVSMV